MPELEMDQGHRRPDRSGNPELSQFGCELELKEEPCPYLL